MLAAPTALLFGLASLLGCGQTCQSTCRHVYDPSECGITHAGVTSDELIDVCVDECARALSVPGQQGSYNPRVHNPAQENFILANDAQAAAWIDCVWFYAPDQGPQDSCVQLDPKSEGKCQPI